MELVGVGSLQSFDQAVQTQPSEVVAHLVGCVDDAQQAAHLGAKAPTGEPEGIEADTQSAEQGHDPRVAES